METIGTGGQIYWRGWKAILVVKSNNTSAQVEEGVTAREWHSNALKLLFVRGAFDADRLIHEAAEHFNVKVASFDMDEIPGRRRHFVRYVYGTAGHTIAHTGPNRKASAGPASAYDTRACMQHRPIGSELSELGHPNSAASETVPAVHSV